MSKLKLIIFIFFLALTENVYAIAPNCSEKKITCGELEKIANSGNIKNIEDFLKAIPKDTMQGFTFITNSLSAQKGYGDSRVTEKWPRVLRSSIDGKVTMTYTCNPQSNTYNGVELMCFENDEFKTLSFRLNRPPGVGPENRVQRNPRTCVQCHAQSSFDGKPSLKPNWPEYFFWSDCKKNRGIQMYGSSDDNMVNTAFRRRLATSKQPQGCIEDEDRKHHREQVEEYKNFRETQKNNPCYSLLPWPTEQEKAQSTWNMSVYPYSTNAQEYQPVGPNGRTIQNYSLRTNTRITDTYSHLMSRRIFNILKKHPEYNKIKYFLALEAGNCLTPDDERQIETLMPGLKKYSGPANKTEQTGYTDPRNSSPLLYSFAARVGLKPSDWSMEYNKPDDPVYNAVMFKGLTTDRGDHAIADVVAGEVIKSIGQTDRDIKKVADSSLTRGISEFFGEKFSCIDDLGGGVRTSAKGSAGQLCTTLRSKNTEHLKKISSEAACTTCNIQPRNPITETAAAIRNIATVQMSESAIRGRTLVQSSENKAKCVTCHARSDENKQKASSAFLFIPSDRLSQAERDISLRELRAKAREPDFIKDLGFMVNGKEMPVIRQGQIDTLTVQDRRDIVEYIKSLVQ